MLLDKIVRYTNNYGQAKAKRWQDISRRDLEAFFAVLFISGIQKRKDKPSNWFSENRILENQIMKKIMSGRKFFTILHYLHCCSMDAQLQPNNYTPVNKVKFKMELIEGLVGKTMDDLFEEEEMEVPHAAIHIEGDVRARCAYCALLSRQRRARYKCVSCGVPLCSIGNGKVEDDCFTKAHESEQMRDLVCSKYEQMQKRTTNKIKNST